MREYCSVSVSRLVFCLCISAIALALQASGQLTEYRWTGAGGNSLWSDPANWAGEGGQGGFPETVDDVAIFDEHEEPVTVVFDRSVTNDSLRIGADDVTFEIGDHVYLATNRIMICDVANDVVKVRVKSGTLELERSDDKRDTFIMGHYSKNIADLVAEGTGTVVRTNGRVAAGRTSTAVANLQLLNGAKLEAYSLYVADKGEGNLLVSNGVLGTSSYIAYNTQGKGHLKFVGPEARLAGSANDMYVGFKGKGNVTVAPDAKVYSARVFLGMGCEPGAIGNFRVDGGSFGEKEDGTGTRMTLTMGLSGTSRLNVGSEPTNWGGTGTLELFDGAVFMGYNSQSKDASYAFVGPGSRIHIRDSKLVWCSHGDYKRLPFYFYPGSYYRVELTDRTGGLSAEAPLIYAGASDNGYRVNKIGGSILELELTEEYEHVPGTVFHIFEYAGELEGEFADLPDGHVFRLGHHRFKIEYGPRTAGEITVTAMAPEGTMVIVR